MQLADLDITIVRFLNGAFLPPLSAFFVIVFYFLYAVAFILIFYLWKSKQRHKLFHFILTLSIGLLLVFFLKYGIARPRPYETYPDIMPGTIKTDSSFPSAHTFLAFLCLYFLPKRPKSLKIATIFYLAILIPVGLIYIGVHYPSDVIVAAILGILLPILISEKLTTKLTRKVYSDF